MADAGRDLAHRPYLPCMRGMRRDEHHAKEAYPQLVQTLPWTTWPPNWPKPPPESPYAHYYTPPQPQLSQPDSTASVPSNTLATLAASEESGESSEESGECEKKQKKQNVNVHADNNLVVRKNLLGCKKDPGRCLRSLFSSEVYPATTVVHFAARRRGLARTLSCSLARYSRQTT